MQGGLASAQAHPKLFKVKAYVTFSSVVAGSLRPGMVSVGLLWEIRTAHKVSKRIEFRSLSP